MQPPSKLLSTTELRRALSTRQGTFVVAGVVALLAGAFLLLFLSRYRASVTDSSPVKVLVAKALIEKGSSGDVILTTGMVEQATVKKTELKGGAVKEPSAIRGKVAADDVYPGEQLTSSDFTASTGSLANEITATERAIAPPRDPIDSGHTPGPSMSEAIRALIALDESADRDSLLGALPREPEVEVVAVLEGFSDGRGQLADSPANVLVVAVGGYSERALSF